jgi:4-oxalocrotonate tautomerase
MERTMPHVTVRLYSGRSEQQKARLAEAVTKALVTTLGSSEESISVGIEDIAPQDWAEKVYKPDILGKADTIYKKPGYNPL